MNALEAIYGVTTAAGAWRLLAGRGPKKSGPTTQEDVAYKMVDVLGKGAVTATVADAVAPEALKQLTGFDVETLEAMQQIGDWYHLGGWPKVQRELELQALRERDRWIGGAHGDIAQLDLDLKAWVQSSAKATQSYVDDWFTSRTPQVIIWEMLRRRRDYGRKV